MYCKHALLIAAGLIAATATSAQAGILRFTIEAPGVQTSQVTGHPLTTETFDSVATGDYVALTSPTVSTGTYTAGGSFDMQIFNQAQTGGAQVPSLPTNFLAIPVQSSATYTPTSPLGYFGFWWSAGDGENQLIVNMADGSSKTFSTQEIVDSPNLQTSGGPTGLGHYGNPTTAFLGQLPTEIFAYVNIYAQDAQSRITSIVFQSPGAIANFETDNHTISTDLIDPNNQTGEPVSVPVPATALLLGAGLGLIGWTRRRRRAAE
jgi:hypothetical protein